ncbi:thiol:disulfide interchange protein DsbA [Formosimonas limnophila]|uniref:Thiol:disulfide interchange protein DsbA n=2 Tax=Formosimonas limnophila TaxID=1384487 RepID=A0A8J3G004_9BURK|nr:thiol:disulfide interchange protein DsbA [Formosimonas limnophila]
MPTNFIMSPSLSLRRHRLVANLLRLFVLWLSMALLILLPRLSWAVESEVLADVNTLESVSAPGRVQPVGDVEVVEFFWYGCAHCNAVHRQLDGWASTLPANVRYVRMPVNLTGRDELQQRLYYTLEALDRMDLHHLVFDDIHFGKKKLTTSANIAVWARSKGILSNSWQTAFNSAEVRQKVMAAQAAFARFGLNGVPALVVNGRYALPAGNLNYAVPRANSLITQELKVAK